MTFTLEIAEALGYRDRCQGIDAESRNITLDRFRGRKRLERAYYRGWGEADSYAGNCCKWGTGAARLFVQPPELVRIPIQAAQHSNFKLRTVPI